MNWLFKLGEFTMSSGKETWWKVECDALTDYDIDTIARWIYMYARPFSEVVGVPTGGDRLAKALESFCVEKGPRLVVDDVLSTGASILAAMDRADDIGFVIFARGPVPERVRAMWILGEEDMVE